MSHCPLKMQEFFKEDLGNSTASCTFDVWGFIFLHGGRVKVRREVYFFEDEYLGVQMD